MKDESKNAFMEKIIDFFITKLVEDNRTLATPESDGVGEDGGPKDFYQELDEGAVKNSQESSDSSEQEDSN